MQSGSGLKRPTSCSSSPAPALMCSGLYLPPSLCCCSRVLKWVLRGLHLHAPGLSSAPGGIPWMISSRLTESGALACPVKKPSLKGSGEFTTLFRARSDRPTTSCSPQALTGCHCISAPQPFLCGAPPQPSFLSSFKSQQHC